MNLPIRWSASGATASGPWVLLQILLTKAASQGQRVPEGREGQQRDGAGNGGGDTAEEDVGDQHDRAGHRQGEEPKPDDREPVCEKNQVVLLLLAKRHPVVGGRRDQQDGRSRGEEQGREVDPLLERCDFGEVLLKRDSEQKCEQHLDPRQRYPQLLEQLAEIAIEPFSLALFPS